MAATTARCQTFGGIIAQDGIDQTGGSAICDSWDSSTSLHSIWQTNFVFRRNYFNPSGTQYGVWSNTLSFVSNSYPSRTADVVVFTESNGIYYSGTIAGYIGTGTNGTTSLAAASIGDLAWCFGAAGQYPNGDGTSGIEPGHYLTNANFYFQSYPLPTPTDSGNGWMNWSNVPAPPMNSVISIGGMWTNSAGVWSYVGGTLYTNTSGSGFVIGGVTYPYVITNRLGNTNWVYYSASQINNQNLFVDAQYVVLYLTNGLTVGNGHYLTINTNADLQIWSGGNISVNGGGVINNMGNYTHAFSLYDVAGHGISVTLAGSGGQATGYYYLPSSALTFSAGGGGSSDFVGAVVCYNLTIMGGQRVHFDESLGVNLSPSAAQPILSGFFTPSKDWFTCHLVGVTGLDYTIEASTDLVNWIPVWTNTSPFVFTQTNMSAFPQQFYRPLLTQ